MSLRPRLKPRAAAPSPSPKVSPIKPNAAAQSPEPRCFMAANIQLLKVVTETALTLIAMVKREWSAEDNWL